MEAYLINELSIVLTGYYRDPNRIATRVVTSRSIDILRLNEIKKCLNKLYEQNLIESKPRGNKAAHVAELRAALDRLLSSSQAPPPTTSSAIVPATTAPPGNVVRSNSNIQTNTSSLAAAVPTSYHTNISAVPSAAYPQSSVHYRAAIPNAPSTTNSTTNTQPEVRKNGHITHFLSKQPTPSAPTSHSASSAANTVNNYARLLNTPYKQALFAQLQTQPGVKKSEILTEIAGYGASDMRHVTADDLLVAIITRRATTVSVCLFSLHIVYSLKTFKFTTSHYIIYIIANILLFYVVIILTPSPVSIAVPECPTRSCSGGRRTRRWTWPSSSARGRGRTSR